MAQDATDPQRQIGSREVARRRERVLGRGLLLSLLGHALVVAVFVFLGWPDRDEPDEPLRTVEVVLGRGAGGAAGGGTDVRAARGEAGGGAGPAAERPGAAAERAASAIPADRPLPTGSATVPASRPVDSAIAPRPAAPQAAAVPPIIRTEIVPPPEAQAEPRTEPPRTAEAEAPAEPERTPPPEPQPLTQAEAPADPERPPPPKPRPKPDVPARYARAEPAQPDVTPPPLPEPPRPEPLRAPVPPPEPAPEPAGRAPAAAEPAGAPVPLFPGREVASAGGGAGPGALYGPGGPGAAGEGTGGAGRGTTGEGRAAIGDGARDNPGDDYLDRLRRHLLRYKRYPEAAKERKQEGRVLVAFTILRDGTVQDPQVDRGSGSTILDEAAIEMLRAASPVPPLPYSYQGDRVRVAIPVTYELSFISRMF